MNDGGANRSLHLQHLFKMLYRLLDFHHDLRDRLAYYEADQAEADAVVREVNRAVFSNDDPESPVSFGFLENMALSERGASAKNCRLERMVQRPHRSGCLRYVSIGFTS